MCCHCGVCSIELLFQDKECRDGGPLCALMRIVALKVQDKHAPLNIPYLLLSETPCQVIRFAVQFAVEDTLHDLFSKTHHNIYLGFYVLIVRYN